MGTVVEEISVLRPSGNSGAMCEAGLITAQAALGYQVKYLNNS